MTPDAIGQVFALHRPALVECEALWGDAARLDVAWRTGDDGWPSGEIEVRATSDASPGLVRCVQFAIRDMRFAPDERLQHWLVFASQPSCPVPDAPWQSLREGGIDWHFLAGAAPARSQRDRFAAQRDQVAQRLGVAAPARIHVYLYPDVATKKRLTESTSNAHTCWLPRASPDWERVPCIHTPFAVDVHELTHAVAANLGQPPLILEEGLAVVFRGSWQGETVSAYGDALIARGGWVPLPEAFDDRVFSAETTRGPDSYGEAGLFVARLDEWFGTSTLLRLYASVRPDANQAAAIREILGTNLECLDLAFTGPPGWSTSAAVGCPAVFGL
jgi:hypothetical protein